jgi:hypothetical protein
MENISNSGEPKMMKSIIGALLLGAVTMTGFAGLAQAGWTCPMPITKGGCPMVPQPGPQPPQPGK